MAIMITRSLTLLLAFCIAIAFTIQAQEQIQAGPQDDSPYAQLTTAFSLTKTDDERRDLLLKNHKLLTKEFVLHLHKIGPIFTQQGEPDKALATLLAGQLAAQELGDKVLIGSLSNELGVLFEAQTNYDEARRYYQQTLQFGRDVDNKILQSWGITGISNIDKHQGNYTKAHEGLEEALRLANESKNGNAIAYVLQTLGALEMSRGDLVSALSYARQSVETDKKYNPQQTPSSLSGLGEIYTLLGDYVRAQEIFSEASLALDPNNPLHKEYRGQVLTDVATIYFHQGDYARSLDLFGQVLTIAKEFGSPAIISDISDLMADVYLAQGDSAQALKMYKEALGIAEQMKVVELQMKINNNLAEAYLLQRDYQQAQIYSAKALSLAEATGNKSEQWNALLTTGNILREKNDYAGASKKYQQALRLAEEINSQSMIARTWAEIGSVALKQGEFQKSFAASTKAAQVARFFGMSEILWRALTTSGRAQVGLQQFEAASGSFTDAIDVIERLNMQVAGSDETRHRFFENKVEPYQEMVKLLLRRGDKWAALQYTERTKARVLGDIMGNGRTDIYKTMSPDEIERERALNYKIVSLNNQLKQERLEPRKDEKLIAALLEKLDKARLEYEGFQSVLYARRPQLRLQRAHIPAIQPSDVSKLIDDNTAVIEYLLTPGQLYTFVITKQKVRGGDGNTPGINLAVQSIAVDNNEFTALAKDFRKQVGERQLDFPVLARQFYVQLIKPISALLPEKSILCIVPDGSLWELPFQALISERKSYLLEEHPIFYAPSLSILNIMRSKRPKSETPSIVKVSSSSPDTNSDQPKLLAVGNPMAGNQTIARAKAVRSDLELGDLPDAEREVVSLSNLFGVKNSKVFIRGNADESLVKKEAPHFNVLHFATHGMLDDKSPMYSWLLMANRTEEKDEDGLLEAWEVAGLDLKADLVTLSACETARGAVFSGEGMIGMSWAFFAAGTSSLVASQWEVDSPSTSELMVNMYTNMREKGPVSPASKARALQQAALRLRQTGKYELPYYWAGFILLGNPD